MEALSLLRWGFFMPSASEVLGSDQIRRALVRIAHEILERNGGASDLALVGIRSAGAPIAERIADAIAGIEGGRPSVGSIDVTLYRDDSGRLGRAALVGTTDIPFDVDGRRIVLVDDVLYTGRTIRSALAALMDLGRPEWVQLAVLVDRGHRELPIRPDYVGKNIPTSRTQRVSVSLKEQGDDVDAVRLEEGAGSDA
jgi:pyrimidine operon attenuation protein/uracil phosphoribosyltransferase